MHFFNAFESAGLCASSGPLSLKNAKTHLISIDTDCETSYNEQNVENMVGLQIFTADCMKYKLKRKLKTKLLIVVRKHSVNNQLEAKKDEWSLNYEHVKDNKKEENMLNNVNHSDNAK